MRTDRLSPREIAVWILIARGWTTMEMARHFGRSHKTVDAHRGNLYRKLGITHAVAATHAAIAHGLIVVEVLPPERRWPAVPISPLTSTPDSATVTA